MKKVILYYIIPFFTISSVIMLFFVNSQTEYSTEDYIKWKIEEERNEKPSYGHPDKAMEWFYEQRAFPLGYIPENWREEALDHIEKYNQPTDLFSKSMASEWTQVGPGNFGGRIRSILVHPTNSNIIYIGAVSGGVWKTTNGGTNWFPLKDNMENLAVCALVMDPDNPNIIYAGTGEGFYNDDYVRGEGIFKTTNGGNTWTQLSSTKNSNFYYVNKLTIDKTTNIIWAGTRRGLYKSDDDGSSFSAVITSSSSNLDCSDIEIAYTSPSRIYAAFGIFEQSEIKVSTNSGSTWKTEVKLTGHGRIEIATSNSNPLIAYASLMDLETRGIGSMIHSTNGGLDWYYLEIPGPTYAGKETYAGSIAWYANILEVDPLNSSIVYAAGIDFWKSTDAGSSWVQKTNWYEATGAPPYAHADQHAIAFDPGNSNIVFVGTDGGIFKTTNKGETWKSLNNNLFITQFYYGAVHPTESIYFGGTQDNGTLKSQSTEKWYEISGGDGGATEVDFNNPQIIYMEYVDFCFRKSTNGGESWVKAMNGIPTGSGPSSGTTDRTLFITPFSMDPNNSNTLVAGTFRVWRTTNGASNWSAISEDLTGDGSGDNGECISTVIIAKGNSQVIYAGCGNGRVVVTTNSGGNWTVRSTALPELYCTRIATAPSNPAKAYAVFSGFSDGKKVFKTTNYGQSWTNISSNLPNVPVNVILVNPENESHLLIGTDLGVFSSYNDGGSWVKDNNGLANVRVSDLDYRQSDGKVFAATHGRSMYYSILGSGGNQIALLDEGFENTFPPDNWAKIVNNSDKTWKKGNVEGHSFNGIDPSSDYSAICPYIDQEQNEWLITPVFSLGNGNSSIEFYAGYSTGWLDNATLKLHISTNGGTSWIKLWQAEDDGLDWTWRKTVLDLSAYSNKKNLKLGWQYIGNDGDIVGIDAVRLLGPATDFSDEDHIVNEFKLYQNYPNPFNPSTSIKFTIPERKTVSVTIYDINGQEVIKLLDTDLDTGTQTVIWDGQNNFGSSVASGIYFCRVYTQDYQKTIKMILLK